MTTKQQASGVSSPGETLAAIRHPWEGTRWKRALGAMGDRGQAPEAGKGHSRGNGAIQIGSAVEVISYIPVRITGPPFCTLGGTRSGYKETPCIILLLLHKSKITFK